MMLTVRFEIQLKNYRVVEILEYDNITNMTNKKI